MQIPTYVFPLAILAWGAFRLAPFIRARLMRGKPVPAMGDLVTERQASHPRLLVYFWSPSCMMCHGMSKIIDQLMEERDDVIKVNAAESLDVARRFKVMGTPCLVLVEDGKVQRMLVGTKSESQIRALLEPAPEASSPAA